MGGLQSRELALARVHALVPPRQALGWGGGVQTYKKYRGAET
jgi:hypothetical protein